MYIRKCRREDLPERARLFSDTVVNVNIKDYSEQQISTWSGRSQSLLSREDFLDALYTLVAVEDDAIVGYGNISRDGYIDHLYTHKDFQRRGIASAICDELERHAYNSGAESFTAHVSVTALPFFIRRGYHVVKELGAKIDGISLTNFLCKKNPLQ